MDKTKKTGGKIEKNSFFPAVRTLLDKKTVISKTFFQPDLCRRTDYTFKTQLTHCIKYSCKTIFVALSYKCQNRQKTKREREKKPKQLRRTV